MTNIPIEYTKNDFMYYSDNYIDKPLDCSIVDVNKPCSMNDPDCYEIELCKNKKYADILINQLKQTSGSDERYVNTTKKYDKERIYTANLTLGMLLCGIFIYYNRNFNKIMKCVKIGGGFR